MTEPMTGAPPTGGQPGGASPAPAAPPAVPDAPAVGQQKAQPDPLADHDDGLFEVKDGDPAWIKRLRTQGAVYRTERNQLRERVLTLENEVQQRDERDRAAQQQQIASRREAVAKQHGLWDDKANDGKGGLLPGIDLGNGTAEEMGRTAEAIVSKLRGGGTGGGGRRPVTVAGTTSGTSDPAQPGAGRAAAVLREFMRNRPSTE